MTPTNPPVPPPAGSSEDLTAVPFYQHQLGVEEAQSLEETLASVFLTTGPRTRAFEQAAAERLRVGDTVGVSSCTMGLFLALKAMGVGPGDEVITSPMTFITSPNVICHCGATPVFADVDPGTGNLTPDAVAARITPRTRGLLPVHLYGQMVDMRGFRDLADRDGLFLIEDAAHAFEAERDGVRPGELGDAAAFSFYATKNLACGEGGLVATRTPEVAEALRRLRLHGMSKDAYGRYQGQYQHWDMTSLGFKANLPDVLSALLMPQLAHVDDRRNRRADRWAAYRDALDARGLLDGRVELPRIEPDSTHSHHLFTIRVDPERRDAVLQHLQDAKIGVAVNYRAVHLLSWYRETFGHKPGDFPVAESIGDRTLSLPFHPHLTDRAIERVVAVLGDALDG